MLLLSSLKKGQNCLGVAMLESCLFLSLSISMVFSIVGIIQYFEESRNFRMQIQNFVQQQLLSDRPDQLKNLSDHSIELLKEHSYGIEVLLYKVDDLGSSLLDRKVYGDRLITTQLDQKKVVDLINLQAGRQFRFLKEKLIREQSVVVVRGLLFTRGGASHSLVNIGVLPKNQYFEKIVII